ncbi:hypothetical protein P6P37_17770, partial [Clostridium perfringens]|nr:hypothetical protein [Clostridium perfringens]
APSKRKSPKEISPKINILTLPDRTTYIKQFATNEVITCPANILAASRRPRAKGRIIVLIISHAPIGGPREIGIPVPI